MIPSIGKFKLRQLGECVRLINGRAYSQEELLESGTPVIRIQNLNGGDRWYYSNLNLPEDKHCIDGDLLFAWSASFGPYIWSGPRSIYHYHIWKIIPLPGFDKNYLFHLLGWITESVKAASRGVAMLHMTKSGMEAWKVPAPPIAEQRRIAAILDQADALRAKRREALAELDGLAQAIFVEMFGDPLENTKQWPILAMAELFSESPNFGTMIPAKSEGGKWLCLRVANIQHWEIDLSDKKYVDLPEETWHRHEAQEGDLLMARAIATQEHLGKCIIAHPKSELWAFDSHLMRLRFNKEKSLPEYIRQMLRTPGGRALFLKASRKRLPSSNLPVGKHQFT